MKSSSVIYYVKGDEIYISQVVTSLRRRKELPTAFLDIYSWAAFLFRKKNNFTKDKT